MYKDVNKTYLVGIASSNINKYKSLGYECNIGDKFSVSVKDLEEVGSIIKVELVCDRCNKEFQRQARQIKERQASNKYCLACQNNILRATTDEDKKLKAKARFDEKDLEIYGVTGLTHQEKIAKTCFERYGVTNAFAAEHVKEKIADTNTERYGHPNAGASEQAIKKIKATKLERYGSETYCNLEQAKQTNLKNHGVEHSFQIPHVIEQIRKKSAAYFDSEEFMEFRHELRKEKRWGEYREDLDDWTLYKVACRVFTNQNDLSKLEHYEKRGLAGVDGAYQLDHIVSMRYGFENNVDPMVIGNINNIKFISWEENLKKGIRSHMSLEELTEKIKGDS